MNLPISFQELYLLLFIICLLGLIGACIVFIKQVFTTEKKFEEKEAETIREYKNVLLHAHQDAEKILTEAEMTETKLSQDMLLIQQNILEEARNTAKQTISELSLQYQENARLLESNMNDSMKSLFDGLQKTTEKKVDTWLQTLSANTVGMQERISKQAEEGFTKLQQELDEFKTQQQNKIASEVNTLVIKASADLLGKTITHSEHQTLLMEAIEKAKKEGTLFS